MFSSLFIFLFLFVLAFRQSRNITLPFVVYIFCKYEQVVSLLFVLSFLLPAGDGGGNAREANHCNHSPTHYVDLLCLLVIEHRNQNNLWVLSSSCNMVNKSKWTSYKFACFFCLFSGRRGVEILHNIFFGCVFHESGRTFIPYFTFTVTYL